MIGTPGDRRIACLFVSGYAKMSWLLVLQFHGPTYLLQCPFHTEFRHVSLKHAPTIWTYQNLHDPMNSLRPGVYLDEAVMIHQLVHGQWVNKCVPSNPIHHFLNSFTALCEHAAHVRFRSTTSSLQVPYILASTIAQRSRCRGSELTVANAIRRYKVLDL